MSRAESLLDRMRRTKTGYGWNDFDAVYRHLGCEVEECAKHTKYVHAGAGILASVPRHKTLATGYAVTAVKHADAIRQWEEDQGSDGE